MTDDSARERLEQMTAHEQSVVKAAILFVEYVETTKRLDQAAVLEQRYQLYLDLLETVTGLLLFCKVIAETKVPDHIIN